VAGVQGDRKRKSNRQQRCVAAAKPRLCMQSGFVNSFPFDPAGMNSPDMAVKEVKNGRLAMVSVPSAARAACFHELSCVMRRVCSITASFLTPWAVPWKPRTTCHKRWHHNGIRHTSEASPDLYLLLFLRPRYAFWAMS
jgi:hypothetical protein